MPRLLGLDLETTGLDTSKEAITEMGLVLWDGDKHRPIAIEDRFFWDDYVEQMTAPAETQAMMERVSGIQIPMLKEFGMPTDVQLAWLSTYCIAHQVDYIVAHNGENYDRPLLSATLARVGLKAEPFRAIPWIDTKNDLPFIEEPDSRKLKHLALDCGFINGFPHRAVTDVLTMLKVLSHYPLPEVIEFSKIPLITVRILVEYADRQAAKDLRYSWEKIGDKTYPKCWVKKIRANALEAERAKSKFKIVQID